MWGWEQGRIAYFQFDALRAVSRFMISHDIKGTDPQVMRSETGLEFLPLHYTPWRNYARIFKLCLLASEVNKIAVPTDIAKLLSQTGSVTCDEYMHFLAEATTSPSPALSNWNSSSPVRYPLCFSLKYILAKTAFLNEYATPIDEIIGAYANSRFKGDESDTAFTTLMDGRSRYQAAISNNNAQRQARESIKVLCQISYLHSDRDTVIVSLNREDAQNILQGINPVGGPRDSDGDKEIQRLASLFLDRSPHNFFSYGTTAIPTELDHGFIEGSRIKRAHTVIERNSKLRSLFFTRQSSPICDACRINTHAKYPWAERILDLHHLLPLSSGTRVDAIHGTLLDDLIAICPTCHRAIHRFYDQYLRSIGQSDFLHKREAIKIYNEAKNQIQIQQPA